MSRIAAGSGGTVVLTLAYENQNIAALLDIPIVKAGTETATAPIGTGPYVYTAGESGSVSLTRNSSWWKGESLPLQTIPLETYKDSDTIAYAFYAREIQLLTCDLTATTPSNVSGSGAYTDADTTVLQYVGVNTSRPRWPDPAVRRALSLGIDRAGLVKSFLMGHAARRSSRCPRSRRSIRRRRRFRIPPTTSQARWRRRGSAPGRRPRR